MSTHPADFRVEIIKARPQGVVSDSLGAPVVGEVIDITSRVPRDGFGTINRAVERDFLSFKTGDLTLTVRNHDGYFDDLFAFFTPTDVWGMRVYRRGEIQFSGCIIGLGSIIFDKKAKTVEFTIYGLTKLLDLTSAAGVSRNVSAMTWTSGSGTSMVVNSTTGLLTGDTLHIGGLNAEDVTVRSVQSATSILLEAALTASHTAGDPVTLETPFYRYKTPEFLVNALFAEAGIGMAQLSISGSFLIRPAPTPVNVGGLDLGTYAPVSPPVQKDGNRFQHLNNAGGLGKSFYQSDSTFDGDWTLDDTTAQPWVDWSRYYVTQPTNTPRLRARGIPGQTSVGLLENASAVHACGYDFQSIAGSGRHFNLHTVAGNTVLRINTTVDYGTTWAAGSDIAIRAGTIGTWLSVSNDYDPIRDDAYIQYNIGGILHSEHVDVGTGTITSIIQSGDGLNHYFGFCYIPTLDYTVCMRSTDATGPLTQIAAFRGTTQLWVRSFPSCYAQQGTVSLTYTYPTQTMRYINGWLLCLCISDGAIQFVASDDEFQTYSVGKLEPDTINGNYYGARVNDGYATVCYSGATVPKSYNIAIPGELGTIKYADFTDMSVGEALKLLAVFANALFWIDDDLQGHFVSRDLYDAGAVQDITNRVKERSDTILWEQTSQWTSLTGNDIAVTSGDQAFAVDGIELESSLLPNECFAQALVDSYQTFYSKQRQYSELEVHDVDGRIYRPLDRVMLDGILRCLVFESDHALTDDSVTLTVLEDN